MTQTPMAPTNLCANPGPAGQGEQIGHQCPIHRRSVGGTIKLIKAFAIKEDAADAEWERLLYKKATARAGRGPWELRFVIDAVR